MPGLASLRELLTQRAPSKSDAALHSFTSLSAFIAATSAASSAGLLPYHPFSRYYLQRVAYCEEAQHDFDDSYQAGSHEKEHRYGGLYDLDSHESDNPESLAARVTESYRVREKSYHVTLKPLFYALSPPVLGLTILRALAFNFQPVLESYIQNMKEEDEDEFEEEEEPPVNKEPIDVEKALKGSGWTTVREVVVVTTRRVLERVIVRHCSKRTSWKLLKDLSRSAARKAGRRISKLELFIGVQKTTFRGHAVGVAAVWLVQLAVDIYTCIRRLLERKRKLAGNNIDTWCQVEIEELTILWRKIVGNTLKSCASLVCASSGAGIGAVLIRPALGQWLGCMIGDYAGALGMSLMIDPWIVFGRFKALDED